MNRKIAVLMLLLLAGLALPSWAGTSLRLGILGFRPKPQALAQWQPLAAYLQSALGQRIELAVYTPIELEAAVAQHKVDVVLTNPGHFILLKERYQLSAPLATQVSKEGNSDLSVYGGVIFTRAEATTIASLADLADKRIASIGTDSFGGYQMQAFELREAGVSLPSQDQFLFTGMPQDQVLNAVLSGRADAGFIRSGLLESLAREGRLDLGRIRIIHQQKQPDFPYASSTRLYPEWPVALVAQTDQHLASRLAVAFLSLPHDSAAARAAGIHGFVVPADYQRVEFMLRSLRIPPFNGGPDITLDDLWEKYEVAVTALLLVLVLLLAGMGARLVRQNRDVRQSKARLDRKHLHLQTLLNTLPDLVWLKDVDGVYLSCNSRFERFVGTSESDIIGKTDYDLFGREMADFFRKHDQAAMSNNVATVNDELISFADDGHSEMLETTKTPMFDSQGQLIGVLGIGHNITARKTAETRLQLAASVFTHAREGIVITDAAGNIVDVNDTFSRITGYSREEALGKNPRMFKSGQHRADYYTAMWETLTETGHWDGEVWNRRKNGELYAELITISAVRDAAGTTQNYVALFTDITQMKEHEKQLEHIAHYDALTALPNRVLLADRLRHAKLQCQRRNRSLAVVYLDLDGFKAVNDNHGHKVGDELLIEVAQRMKEALREGDTLARIGGDEFVAVLVDLVQPQDCEPVLGRLLQAASAPVLVGEAMLHVSASIGVTIYPQDGADADLLLRHADQAMYQAKQGGKNRYHLFDVAHDEAVTTRHESIGHIRSALDQRQFVLHYQPKVNMRTGAVVGVEALVRWQHPERGLLLPAAFLPIIEDHPVIVGLGEWVIATALAQMAEWLAAGLQIPVSVNIGARQLQQEGFVARLSQLLAAHPDVQPSCLQLEILETSALEDIAQVSGVMRACQALGVHFALDDFGTGYSSLTYLKRLPVELLKIDQSFVRDMLDDPDDLAIVQAVMGLAHAFNRQVIAEGVETVAHSEQLLPLGCELVQGYGIALPMTAGELPGWLASWQPPAAWAAWYEQAPQRIEVPPPLFGKKPAVFN
jgi:diguanylate cyclase (GGDEF)-like protein/PAS domain S-box-containing protein